MATREKKISSRERRRRDRQSKHDRWEDVYLAMLEDDVRRSSQAMVDAIVERKIKNAETDPLIVEDKWLK